MKFLPTSLEQVILIQPDPHRDDRGEFARLFCEKEFSQAGLHTRFVQSSYSTNVKKGILRGMHFQTSPMAEDKLVRCTRGSIYDVVVDLRPHSKTYLKWYAVELTEKNHFSLWIPRGCAHGYQTLTDETEVHYLMDEFYSPDHATGIPYDDTQINIHWPLANPVVSEKDRSFSPFKP